VTRKPANLSGLDETKLQSVAPGVFYTKSDIVAVDQTIVTYLKTAANISLLKRARLCAHPNPNSTQHDMLIVSHKNSYIPPHRHFDKTETMIILEGRADAILFDENGQITDVLRMGSKDSGLLFFYRMPERQYHSLLIRDEWLIFIENTKGPFTVKTSQNAPWAPEPEDIEAGITFKKEMNQMVEDFFSQLSYTENHRNQD